MQPKVIHPPRHTVWSTDCVDLTDPFQRAFLRLFADLPDQEQFYLAGATALAEFYLGHHLSFDLDLFTAESDLILHRCHCRSR